jgi:anti-sigma B factor antagonist
MNPITPTTALPLGPELTIAFAAATHETLLAALSASDGDLHLDLAGVTDFDSSAVQLLLSARRSLADRGQMLRVVCASAPVRDGLKVFGLNELLAPTAPT